MTAFVGAGGGTWGLEHLVQAADHILDSIEITDLDYRLLYVNPAFERLFGYSRAESLGRTPAELMPKEEHPRAFFLEIMRSISQGVPWRGLMRSRTKDGERTEVDAVISAVYSADGQITHFVAVKRDVRRQQRELEARVERVERLASLGTLAAGVGHELNNPLAYAIANMQFIEAQLGSNASPQVSAAVKETLWGLEHMRTIVSNVAELARPDHAQTEPVDVDAAVRQALSTTRSQLDHRAEVVTHLSSPPRADASTGRLAQVLVNLLINAGQSIPEAGPRGRIEVHTACCDDYVSIEVHDNGAGVDRESLPHIFDPFFTTGTDRRGTGLGLAIAHQIITSFGGTIEVRDRPGAGTVFRVTLNRATEPPDAPGAPPEPAVQDGRRGNEALRVLLIDDDDLVLHALQRAMGEHNAVAVSSVPAALAVLDDADPFDCILCDLMMPTMNGVDFYECLRVRDERAAARVVFMTGGAFTDRTRAFATAMAGRVLNKPFTLAQLRVVVNTLAE